MAGADMTAIERLVGDRAAVADRTVARLRRYVEAESPSREEALVRRLAEQVAADLAATGAIGVRRVEVPGYGEHVLAEVPGVIEDRYLLALGHLDTVHPAGTLAVQPFRVEAGRVEGPGAYDMKGSVAVLVSALELMRDRRLRPKHSIRVLLTCDEEVGSHSGRLWIEKFAPTAVAALVLEPSLQNGGVKTSRKGVDTYRVRVIGQAAHAGMDPGSGVSAIAELAHQVTAILDLADPARGTTVNVGTIEGGTATNVVAAEATAYVDARFWTQAEADRIHTALKGLSPKLPGARLEVERTESRPPLERTEGVVRLYERAREIGLELGVDLPEGGTGGGSDGCLTAALGVPTLDGLGPLGWGAHAADEHIIYDDLPFRVALLARLLTEL